MAKGSSSSTRRGDSSPDENIDEQLKSLSAAASSSVEAGSALPGHFTNMAVALVVTSVPFGVFKAINSVMDPISLALMAASAILMAIVLGYSYKMVATRILKALLGTREISSRRQGNSTSKVNTKLKSLANAEASLYTFAFLNAVFLLSCVFFCFLFFNNLPPVFNYTISMLSAALTVLLLSSSSNSSSSKMKTK